ncbi:hypothetical protein DEFR109230_04410 [Deinococcus frigens]
MGQFVIGRSGWCQHTARHGKSPADRVFRCPGHRASAGPAPLGAAQTGGPRKVPRTGAAPSAVCRLPSVPVHRRVSTVRPRRRARSREGPQASIKDAGSFRAGRCPSLISWSMTVHKTICWPGMRADSRRRWIPSPGAVAGPELQGRRGVAGPRYARDERLGNEEGPALGPYPGGDPVHLQHPAGMSARRTPCVPVRIWSNR